MNFLTPLAFLGGLLAIPIVLLYMLRLRRREVMISSTFLWRQVLQDQEANTPWQRLRRNLLLILQLIILMFIVFALARPYMTVPAVGGEHITILLDASASMNATDIDGKSRFEEAKSEALAIVSTLGRGNRMTVIRVTGVPEMLVSSSDDPFRLSSVIRDAKPGYVPADWESALNLALAGGAGVEDFTIVIIGDGGLPDTVGLPGTDSGLRYIPVGTAGDNVAITALATRALPGEIPQLYAQITNYSNKDARVVFSLLVDDRSFASSNYVVPANSNLPIISSALPRQFQTLKAELVHSVNSEVTDYLPIDDAAYAVSGAGDDSRVLLVTEGNLYIEQVLRSLSGLEVVLTNGQAGIPPDYDLYIFDNFLPQELPLGDVMFINPPSSFPGLFTLGELSNLTSNMEVVDNNDPRMLYVDVGQLNLLRFHEIYNTEWADNLITTDGGVVFLAGDVDGRQVAVLPFDLRESDLPLQITWPVMMANMIEWFAPHALISVDNVRAGSALEITPPYEVDSVRIIPPENAIDNDPVILPVKRDIAVFSDTNVPGIYEIELLDAGQIIGRQLFAVNLFSPLESNIAPVAQTALEIEGTTITEAIQEEMGQRDYWPHAAMLAVIILLLEWYIYHHRLRVPDQFKAVPTS